VSDLYLKKLEDNDISLLKVWLNKPHVLKWFKNPQAWIDEINNRDAKYNFIKHFIVMYNDTKIGFCQYYDYQKGKETWHNNLNIENTYSIDYLIGEQEYLGKHIGTLIVKLLNDEIAYNTNAAKIIVQPEINNYISRRTLLSAGYEYDKSNDIFLNNMENLVKLVRPSMKHKEDALAFKQAFFDNDEMVIDGSELLDRKQTYEEWLAYVDEIKDLQEIRSKSVRTDTFFALDRNNQIVGIIDLRHELNDFFKDFGHCGYSVKPSERRKGYASQMLHLVCLIAKESGMKKLQLCALRSNVASVKTIYKNGGKVIRSIGVAGQKADVFEIEL